MDSSLENWGELNTNTHNSWKDLREFEALKNVCFKWGEKFFKEIQLSPLNYLYMKDLPNDACQNPDMEKMS